MSGKGWAKNKKRNARISWVAESKRRDEAREARGIKDIPDAEVDAYTKLLAETRAKLAQPTAPAMPIATNTLPAGSTVQSTMRGGATSGKSPG